MPKLSPTVRLLGVISLIADISSEMLYPITPIFLTTVVGASLLQMGLIEGFAECLSSFLKIYSGAVTDQSGSRKKWVFFGYFFSALAKPVLGSAQTWGQVFGARSLDRFGKGIRTAPRDALIAQSTDSHRMGETFGWHRQMDTLGAAIGAGLALALMGWVSDLRLLYYIAFLPGVLAAFLVLWVPEEKRKSAAGLQKKKLKDVLKGMVNVPMSKELKSFLMIWTFFSVINSSDAFLIKRAQEIGGSHQLVVLQYIFLTLIYAFLAGPLGRFSDQRKKRFIFGVGALLFSAVYLGFSVATQVIWVWALFAVYGVYLAATEGVVKAYVAELSDGNSRGATMGWYGTLTGLANFAASTLMGFVWLEFGVQWAFGIGAIGGAVVALLTFFYGFKRT